MMKFVLLAVVLLVAVAMVVVADDLPLNKLVFRKPGFKIELVARVKNARQIALNDDATVLFVGTLDDGAYGLRLKRNATTGAITQDGDIVQLVSGLKWANGVAFDSKSGDLFVAEIPGVWKVPNAVNVVKNGAAPKPQLIRKYPSDDWHGWKYIKIHGDRIYVPIGSPCNTCLKDLPYGSLTSFKFNETDLQAQDYRMEARGIRNTVGFDWHPKTDDLWFTDNGRDEWGNDRPGDELNRITAGKNNHFGFPYCYDQNLVDPEYNTVGNCDPFVPAAYSLGPHVAALGMRFYQGDMLPASYKNNFVTFIAEHGSWNREVPLGYRITMVNTTNPEAASYEVLVDGWLDLPSGYEPGRVKDSNYAWGRPVDIVEMPDGSLLVSDDKAGAIYRITYKM